MHIPRYLTAFFKALLLLFFVAFLGKTAFFLYHRELFDRLSDGGAVYALIWGYRFDLALAAALALVAFFGAYLLHRLLRLSFERTLGWFTFAACALIVVIHGADALYYPEAGRHLGYELKEWYNSRDALASTAFHSYLLPVSLYLLTLIPLFFICRRLFAWKPNATGVHGIRRFAPEMQLLAVIVFSVFAVRGGFQQVPLEPLHAQEIGGFYKATVALDGAYNALFSVMTPYSITPVLKKSPTAQQVALVKQMFQGYHAAPLTDPKTPPNVVVVLLESWSGAYMKPYGYPIETTPFFDQLRMKSLTTSAMFSGGHRTTEGLFATMCSGQNPLGETVAQNQLQDYDYHCLPQMMRKRGYYTAFFQGTKKNTSGTGAFAQMLGFTDSYGVSDWSHPRYPLNSWGLQDPDVYDMALAHIKKAKRPFFIGINSDSTHDLELPPSFPPLVTPGTQANDYVNVLHFADASLQQFVHELYSNPATANTLLVLVSDHAGPALDTPYSQYLIAFLAYYPGIKPAIVPEIAAQRDVGPTITHLLGIKTPHWFMGRAISASDPGAVHYADYYVEGDLGWAEGNRLVVQSITTHNPDRCYRFGDDITHPTPATCDATDQGMAQRALAFTTEAQHLLFHGDTTLFPEATLPKK